MAAIRVCRSRVGCDRVALCDQDASAFRVPQRVLPTHPGADVVLGSHPVDWILLVSLAHSLAVRAGGLPGIDDSCTTFSVRMHDDQ